MAETYRKGKIIDYTKRLEIKKETIASQLNQSEFVCLRENLLGQLQCLDLTIKELQREFELSIE